MTKLLLLVDHADGGTLSPSMREALDLHGWAVLEASDAGEALELARQKQPDLVLLNLEIGLAISQHLATALKFEPLTCTIPIVVLTPSLHVPRWPGLWAAEFVTTPLEPAILIAKLQRCLVRWQRNQPYVLVVDDEPDLVDILTHALDRHGFLTTGAFDGLQALEIAQAAHPDAILLDLDMPRLNGWQLLERIKADEALASIRVIILTGVAKTEADRQACLSHGADAYLCKPCSHDDIVRTLQMVL